MIFEIIDFPRDEYFILMLCDHIYALNMVKYLNSG